MKLTNEPRNFEIPKSMNDESFKKYLNYLGIK
jgi:hypothetical protein